MFNKIILVFTIFNSYIFTQTLFFSEYAEGSSNNKYLEIYNPTSDVINLGDYAYPSTANAPDNPGEYEYWNEFDLGASINPGDVYVICHGSADPFIASECDENHTYLSNGDDGYCLVNGTDSNYSIIDCIGDWNGDPGDGWEVAGVYSGTKDHTLVRKMDIVQGNSGNWSESAGTNNDDSEWVVLDNETWSYLGSHPHEDFSGGGTSGGTTGGDDGGSDTEDCSNGIDDDGDSYIDCDDFDCTDSCEGSEDCTNGVDDDDDGYIDCNDFDCTGSANCPSEICDDGIDNDDDTYIDCNDFDCSDDPACDTGETGSCAEYGCVGYTPANACQCNDLCVEYDNCCDDYEEICTGEDSGGSDTGGGTGGDDPVDADLIFFSEYAEGSSNNKYLEIYNADDNVVDLGLYSISTCANGCNDGVSWDYPNNVEFVSGTNLNPGDVYIVCNGSADPTILAECDQTFTYLSNGDDVMGLTQLSSGGTVDIIGTIGDDPGDGWDVAGVTNATKDHTLVRKSYVSSGNNDWSSSAGTNADNSEWVVYDQNTWDNIGFHDSGPVSGCTDPTAYNYNSDAAIDDPDSCIYLSEVTIQEIQGASEFSPYEGLPVSASGIITAINSNGFYIQNGGGAWSGIWVYQNFNDSVEVGQEVNVTGYVLEFYGLTEIEADSIDILSSDNELNITEVSTNDLNDESYESVLVQVFDAVCTALPNEYNDWTINDGSGNLLVGDDFVSYSPDLNLAYNIIGVIDYEFSEFKIQALDVLIAYEPGAPVSQAGDDQFVDEGSLVTLDGGSSYDDDGQIIGYEWIQTDGIAVELGNYENQIVQFTAPNQFTILEFSLTVMDNNFNFSYPDYVRITVGSQGIYDVQYTENTGSTEEDCYPSDYVAQVVNITGLVTSVKSFSNYPHFFIQDPNLDEWSGVYVYVGESEPYAIGDEVNFSAEVDEYYGVTELKNIENAQILSQGNVVNSVPISTGSLGLSCGVGEKYEGMFVEFSNVIVESLDEQYNSVYINDGSGTAKLDDYFFNFDAGFWPDFSVGQEIETVRGVVHYYFGEYVVYPRDLVDLGGSGGNTSENCTNGIDDDGDNYVDCDDYDCDDDVACGGTGENEICNDGIDNDGDSYIDCDDYDCDDDDACSGNDGGTTDCDESNLENLFFSEYAEGSSNNKYLEIYNNSEESVHLCGYAFPNSNNGADVDGSYDYWNTFDTGAIINPGDVYVICHPSSDETILAECNQTHTYLSNGDDGFCLVYGNENDFEQIDCIGDWSENDPGDGWDVAGVTAGTKDHTLLRKSSISSGNNGDWASSAGTNSEDSEWEVLEQNDWSNLGFHDSDTGGSDGGDECSEGDMNSDGIVNVIDVVQIVNYVLGIIEFNDDQLCAADLNSDGIVNVIDVVQLVNIILGIN